MASCFNEVMLRNRNTELARPFGLILVSLLPDKGRPHKEIFFFLFPFYLLTAPFTMRRCSRNNAYAGIPFP